MFKFISNIPIFRRLFLAFLLAAIIPGIIISILGAIFVNTQSTRSQAIQVNLDASKAAFSLENSLDIMEAKRPEIISNPPTDFIVRQGNMGAVDAYSAFASAENSINSSLPNFQQQYQLNTSSAMDTSRSILITDDPNDQLASQQQTLLNSVADHLWPDYKNANDKIISTLKRGVPPATADIQAAASKYGPLRNTWEQIVDINYQISSKVAAIGSSQTNPIILGIVIAFFVTILVVVTIGYIVNLTITRPLGSLASLTKRIARGETAARAKIPGHDEISTVAISMNNMLDHIVRLIQETQLQRDNLQSQVEKLVSEVSGVGEGDLSAQAEVTADALGVLADSFNYMVEELASLVVRVKMVATEVESSTAAILDRMTQLVETGDEQIARIGDAAVEVEYMAGSSRQVAELSQNLYEVARNARQDANVGRGAVEQAVGGMGRINDNVSVTATRVQMLGERSREINEIVEAISGIAHQTNRLALDAAIQAAMAGENGKGFGAVAADIRRLAERSKDQATLITRIVRTVREDIGALAVSMQDTERETSAGSRLTQEAGTALESLFSAVEYQSREIEHINQMAMQQLQSSSAIVQIMHGVSESTKQSSFSTRDASRNMERLARLVEQLRASVEAFKLRENQGYLVPNPSMNISIEESPDSALTVSGIFRTVSATAQIAGNGMPAALPPGRSNDTFPPYGAPPNQSQQWGAPVPSGSNWSLQAQQQEQQGVPNQQWGAPAQYDNDSWGVATPQEQQWYNERAGNGNRNR